MNKIQQFIDERSVKPYRIGKLRGADLLELIRLLKWNQIAFYGFDGFIIRKDVAPHAIQIDQDYSKHYSADDQGNAYEDAARFLSQQKNNSVIYEFFYEHSDEDLKVVADSRTRNGITEGLKSDVWLPDSSIQDPYFPKESSALFALNAADQNRTTCLICDYDLGMILVQACKEFVECPRCGMQYGKEYRQELPFDDRFAAYQKRLKVWVSK